MHHLIVVILLKLNPFSLTYPKPLITVWHEGLIFKLKQNGVAGNAINFLINYLSGRRQRVVINATSSEYFQVESGVPQGSVLCNCNDTSADWRECNSAPEDTNHFLLRCNLFQVSRIELINSITLIVSPYNLIDEINNQDLFLYGHRNISSEDKMKIILSTIKYIMETGRFA